MPGSILQPERKTQLEANMYALYLGKNCCVIGNTKEQVEGCQRSVKILEAHQTRPEGRPADITVPSYTVFTLYVIHAI